MSGNSGIRSIASEHRLCGPKYEGCYAHYPWMAHCRACGISWPCDVEKIRAVVEPLFAEREQRVAELQADIDRYRERLAQEELGL